MIRPSTLLISTSLIWLVACSVEEDPSGQQLLVPDDVALHWDESFNGRHDGLGAVVPVDVMVYQGITGEPIGNVELQVEASYEGVGIPVSVEVIEPDDCDDCVFIWDAYRDRYVELLPEQSENSAVLQTDSDGLARLFLYVDSFPAEADGFAPITVTVQSSVDAKQFDILVD